MENEEFLSDEEKELLESTIVLAAMFGYDTSDMPNGFYFTHSEKDKKISFTIYEKKRKLRIVENNIMWQRKSRKEATRISLIKTLQSQLELI